MNNIILIYGMPCSGKTTTCEEMAKLGYDHQISADKIREKDFPNPDYSEKESIQIFENLFNALTRKVKAQCPDIIIDSMFATVGRIIRIKEFAERNDYNVHCVFLYASLDTILKRNEHRKNTPKYMPSERIQMFLERFNSEPLSDLSINTGVNDKGATVHIIDNYLHDGR